MAKRMTRSSKARRPDPGVEAALKRLTAFHEEGRRSLRVHGKQMGHGQMRDASGGNHTKREHLINARRFAGPGGYTKQELAQLFRQCRDAKYPLGRSLMVRLLTVKPRSRRMRIQRQMIDEAWSRNRLNAEINATFHGRGRGAGRPFKRPESVKEALVAIDSAAERQLRLHDLIRNPPENGKKSRSRNLWAGIPESVQKAMAKADSRARALQRAIANELL